MRGHYPLRKEAQHARGVPEMPKGMSKAAAHIWDRLTEQLDPLTLRLADESALRLLCEGEAQILEMYEGLRERAEELKAEAKKENRQLPGGAMFALVSTKEGAAAMRGLRALERNVITQRREFGLTPASRTRVSADSMKDDMSVLDDAMFFGKVEKLA